MKSEVKQTSIKNLKEEYVTEYNFISDLLNRANVPTIESDSSGSSFSGEKPSIFIQVHEYCE